MGNIQTVLHQISASTSDQKILETYKFVAGALKASFADSGISVDAVHGIIDEFKDIFHQQEEISDALRNSFESTDEDSQLEDELRELMNLDGKGDVARKDPERFDNGHDRIVETKKFIEGKNNQRGKVQALPAV